MKRLASLKKIAQEIRSCTLCPLHASRELAVPGEGPSHADIMIIGEAPGQEEDTQGRPFVGHSGAILNSVLRDARIDRKKAFVTNIVKCRPPDNRTPHSGEIQTCVTAHLQRQIKTINPKIICLLGRTALKSFTGIQNISEQRGRIIKQQWNNKPLKLFATFHPAAAGRNPLWKTLFVKDLRKLATQINRNK
jgi:uracil-DNA glycosylase family 4